MDDVHTVHHQLYQEHLAHVSKSRGAISGWTLGEILGRGGYGAVAQAQDETGNLGALKIAHPDVCRKEAEILRALGGEGAPRLLADVMAVPLSGMTAACYVMEMADMTLGRYFEGGDVRSVPHPQWYGVAKDADYRRIYSYMSYEKRSENALAVAESILSALRMASPRVHGDLCPSNVLLFSDGAGPLFVKLADWGNSRSYVKGETSYSLMGGKELWCPPRTRAFHLNLPQAQVEPLTDKADIYGLGALVCWMLTGTVPHQLARWESRNSAKSVSGLPIAIVGKEWHEFLVATTRADREHRIDQDQVADLLSTVRNGARRSITSTTQNPSSSKLSRFRRLSRLATSGALAISVGIINGGVAAQGVQIPERSEENVAPQNPLCANATFYCNDDVLAKVSAEAGTAWPDGVRPRVRSWYHGALSRQELAVGDNAKWIYRNYANVVGMRLDFDNPTSRTADFTPDRLGLMVKVRAGSSSFSSATAPVKFAAAELDQEGIVWIPPMPSAAADEHKDIDRLLKKSVIHPDSGLSSLEIALFDLSNLDSPQIIGLADASPPVSGIVAPVVPTSILLSDKWEFINSGTVKDLMSGFHYIEFRNEVKAGMCLNHIYDIGLLFSDVSCDQPHAVEVVRAGVLDAKWDNVSDSSQEFLNMMGELCEVGRTATSPSVSKKLWGYEFVNSGGRQAGDRAFYCSVTSVDSSAPWEGRKFPVY